MKENSSGIFEIVERKKRKTPSLVALIRRSESKSGHKLYVSDLINNINK